MLSFTDAAGTSQVLRNAHQTIRQLDHLNYRCNSLRDMRITSARYASRNAYNIVLNAIKSLSCRVCSQIDGLLRYKLAAYRVRSRQTATFRSHGVSNVQTASVVWKEKIERVIVRHKGNRKRNQSITYICNPVQ